MSSSPSLVGDPVQADLIREMKLHYHGALVSIESAELTIKAGAGGPPNHQVFGKIMVTGRYDKVYALYDRKEDQPDIIPEGQSRTLRLSGPKYILDSNFTNFIHVRLKEKGWSEKIMEDDLFFRDTRHGWHREGWGIGHTRFVMRAVGLRATLEVTFTRFGGCKPFRVNISPTGAPTGAPWTVSGTVRAIQKTVKCLPGYPSFESSFTLFDRPVEEGVQVSPGELIPLDRSLVVAPVKIEVDGPSLTVVVDLRFEGFRDGPGVQGPGNDNVHHLKGDKMFVFRADDSVSMYPFCAPIAAPEHGPSVDCMLFPVWESFKHTIDEEDAYEYEAPLYKRLGRDVYPSLDDV